MSLWYGVNVGIGITIRNGICYVTVRNSLTTLPRKAIIIVRYSTE